MVCENVGIGLAGVFDCLTQGLFGGEIGLFGLMALFGLVLIAYLYNFPNRLAFVFGFTFVYLMAYIVPSIFLPIFWAGVMIIGIFFVTGIANVFYKHRGG